MANLKFIDWLTAATVPSDRQPIEGVIFKNLTDGLNQISPSVIEVEIFNQSDVNLSNLKLNAKNYSVSKKLSYQRIDRTVAPIGACQRVTQIIKSQ